MRKESIMILSERFSSENPGIWTKIDKKTTLIQAEAIKVTGRVLDLTIFRNVEMNADLCGA